MESPTPSNSIPRLSSSSNWIRGLMRVFVLSWESTLLAMMVFSGIIAFLQARELPSSVSLADKLQSLFLHSSLLVFLSFGILCGVSYVQVALTAQHIAPMYRMRYGSVSGLLLALTYFIVGRILDGNTMLLIALSIVLIGITLFAAWSSASTKSDKSNNPTTT